MNREISAPYARSHAPLLQFAAALRSMVSMTGQHHAKVDDAALHEAEDAVRVWIGNPSAHPEKERSRAAHFFEHHYSSVPELCEKMATAGRMERGRRLLMAAANWHVCTQNSSKVRPLEQVLESNKSFDLALRDFRRLVQALERFYHRAHDIAGASDCMHDLKVEAWRCCFGESLDVTLALEDTIVGQNVLITGETGTGKELIADAIQRGTLAKEEGQVPPRPVVNGAAIPLELAESELFGHVKGAFTNAQRDRVGKIREADTGSLFIDEVADLPAPVQPKLLRAIESDRIMPVGGTDEKIVRVRYVTATSRRIKDMVRAGDFRDDLYQRIAGVVLYIPPLRERREDIEIIAHGLIPKGVSDPQLIAALNASVMHWLRTDMQDYPWRGNVRELASAIGNRKLGFKRKLEESVPPPAEETPGLPERISAGTATEDEVCAWYFRRVFAACDGNQTRTEKTLGINRSTVRRRMAELGILPKKDKD